MDEIEKIIEKEDDKITSEDLNTFNQHMVKQKRSSLGYLGLAVLICIVSIVVLIGTLTNPPRGIECPDGYNWIHDPEVGYICSKNATIVNYIQPEGINKYSFYTIPAQEEHCVYKPVLQTNGSGATYGMDWPLVLEGDQSLIETVGRGDNLCITNFGDVNATVGLINKDWHDARWKDGDCLILRCFDYPTNYSTPAGQQVSMSFCRCEQYRGGEPLAAWCLASCAQFNLTEDCAMACIMAHREGLNPELK